MLCGIKIRGIGLKYSFLGEIDVPFSTQGRSYMGHCRFRMSKNGGVTIVMEDLTMLVY